MLKVYFYFLFFTLYLNGFSQDKFIGGKFCEYGESVATSYTIFDSCGNYFSIGYDFYNGHNKDSFKPEGNEFFTNYGRWSYDVKTNEVKRYIHDSIPLVKIISDINDTFSTFKKITAFDFYGIKVMRFYVFHFVSDSEAIKIFSDSSTGILSLDILKTGKILIPGIDTIIKTQSLKNESQLHFAIPSVLVCRLLALNRHYEEIRKQVEVSNYIWKKPELIPDGSYRLYLLIGSSIKSC